MAELDILWRHIARVAFAAASSAGLGVAALAYGVRVRWPAAQMPVEDVEPAVDIEGPEFAHNLAAVVSGEPELGEPGPDEQGPDQQGVVAWG